MFNILLALVAGILIGWNFHSFFIALTPPQILENDINISTTKVFPLLDHTIKEENKTEKIPIPVSFYTLLNDNFFSDAMALYIDAKHQNILLYRSTLESYFQDKIITDPTETLVQIKEYLNIEPENRTTKLQLIELYKILKKYDKAIHLLIELMDNTPSVIEQEKINKSLIKTSQIYIDELNRLNKPKQLTAFLEEHIEQGLNSPFYTFSLAEHHVKLKEHSFAIKLLKEIEFDEEYGEKAKELLEIILNQQIIPDPITLLPS